ncbi:MAG: CHASE4 domain-containing protein, partial [Rhodanobacteraceae bacterium]
NQSFDNFLESYGAPLKTFAEDSTCLDQLVAAIARNDRSWLSSYFDDSTLAGFHANAVWVFRQDGTLLYEHDNLHARPALALPVPSRAFAQIFAHEPLRHFYIKIPLGLMDIRAGTVHPSQDFQRRSPPYGYLFTGRLWSRRTSGGAKSDSVIGEMSMFTSNDIHLVPATGNMADLNDHQENGVIAFSRPLPDWRGAPLAHLAIINDSPVVRELNRSSQRLL